MFVDQFNNFEEIGNSVDKLGGAFEVPVAYIAVGIDQLDLENGHFGARHRINVKPDDKSGISKEDISKCAWRMSMQELIWWYFDHKATFSDGKDMIDPIKVDQLARNIEAYLKKNFDEMFPKASK